MNENGLGIRTVWLAITGVLMAVSCRVPSLKDLVAAKDAALAD
jgi:uncharacterized iron-regulated protein